MIEWRRQHHNPFSTRQEVRTKIIGVGGAGSDMLDRVVMQGISKADVIAVNTDIQSLRASVATNKVQLGKGLTNGLGAGGDPEVGYQAALDAEDELVGMLDNSPLVFVAAGLGGGTGSGAAPVICNLARRQGAFVVVFATLPFEFEGRRRQEQARAALNGILQSADCVVCFENDRLGEHIVAKTGIHEAFAFTEDTISQSILAIANLVNTPGLIEVGFDELLTVMRNHDPRCLFGYGEAEGENRAMEALTNALKNPLMDKGRLLGHAENVLVNITGAETLTLEEVEKIMKELNSHVKESTHILFGTALDPRLKDRISVTIISSLSGEDFQAAVDKRSVRASLSGDRKKPEPPPITPPEPVKREDREDHSFEVQPAPRPAAPEDRGELFHQHREKDAEKNRRDLPLPEDAPAEPRKFIPPRPAAPEEAEARSVPEPKNPASPAAEAPFFRSPKDEDNPHIGRISLSEQPTAPGQMERPSPSNSIPFSKGQESGPGKDVDPLLRPLTGRSPEDPGIARLPVTELNGRPEPKGDATEDAEQVSTIEEELKKPVQSPRGQFQEEEPTLIRGEDYDIPTFLRRRVKLEDV